MKVELHDTASKHLISLCNSLSLSPQQVIKLLTSSYNNHINKGQPLELQGVKYYAESNKE